MNKTLSRTERQVAYMAFMNRERNVRHHRYDEEMKQYELMKGGNPDAVAESTRMMTSGLNGHLSDDPVRNVKYLLVANITITTRFAIEGGMDSETAYNSSDLFINRMDLCDTVEDVMAVHHEMFTYFTEYMASLKTKVVYSKAIIQCMEYIDLHLHIPIRMPDLACHVDLNQSYLSSLFKRETGTSVSDYIMERRIETARNMLCYSDYSSAQIGEILSFCSQSHFIRCFRKHTGITPGQYRRTHYHAHLDAASGIKPEAKENT